MSYILRFLILVLIDLLIKHLFQLKNDAHILNMIKIKREMNKYENC